MSLTESDGDLSHREVAMRVVVALIEMAEQRAAIIPELSAVVRRVVDELDPDGLRPTEPTWWVDLPAWHRLDSFDRLRRAHDQLLVLEVQAGEVVRELRGMFVLRPVGSGWSPGRAHAELGRLALRRGEMVRDMARAEHALYPRLSRGTSGLLRAGIRALVAHESAAQETRQRLSELLVQPTDLRHAETG